MFYVSFRKDKLTAHSSINDFFKEKFLEEALLIFLHSIKNYIRVIRFWKVLNKKHSERQASVLQFFADAGCIAEILAVRRYHVPTRRRSARHQVKTLSLFFVKCILSFNQGSIALWIRSWHLAKRPFCGRGI